MYGGKNKLPVNEVGHGEGRCRYARMDVIVSVIYACMIYSSLCMYDLFYFSRQAVIQCYGMCFLNTRIDIATYIPPSR
jgi:hypothetical protein